MQHHALTNDVMHDCCNDYIQKVILSWTFLIYPKLLSKNGMYKVPGLESK